MAGTSPAMTGEPCHGPVPARRFCRKLARVSESQTLFAALRDVADADAAAAIERLVESGADRELVRINVLAFAAAHGLDEEATIAAFLHAAQLGIFELSWDVLCPTCRGVLDVTASLKDVHKAPYECALCSRSFEVSLDEMVEVVFTVSPRVRKIAAHDPGSLPFWDYYRQVFWSSAVDLSDADLKKLIADFTLDARVLGPGETATMRPASAGRLGHRVRAGVAFRPLHESRAGARHRRAGAGARFRRRRRADFDDADASRAGAAHHDQPHRDARSAGGLVSRARATTRWSASAGPISPPSASSPTRRSATSIAPTR